MTFGNYQLEIYLQGLSGILPTLPMDYAGWEAKAEVAMPPSIWSYVAGGAGDENGHVVESPAFWLAASIPAEPSKITAQCAAFAGFSRSAATAARR